MIESEGGTPVAAPGLDAAAAAGSAGFGILPEELVLGPDGAPGDDLIVATAPEGSVICVVVPSSGVVEDVCSEEGEGVRGTASCEVERIDSADCDVFSGDVALAPRKPGAGVIGIGA
jgi:hypothetical protein